MSQAMDVAFAALLLTVQDMSPSSNSAVMKNVLVPIRLNLPRDAITELHKGSAIGSTTCHLSNEDMSQSRVKQRSTTCGALYRHGVLQHPDTTED